MKLKVKMIIILAIIALIVFFYRFTPLGEQLNMEVLLKQKNLFLEKVQEAFLLAALIFVVVYIVVTALSIPGATVMTLMGGFLFGPWIGTLFVNIGATTGAVLIFLVARYFLGQDIQAKYSGKLERLNREIEKNGKSYFLTLRLIPIFPFFLINLLAGFTKIPFRTFLWTTSLGIIPGSFVYAYLGSTGAGTGTAGSFGIQIAIALTLLGLLSLVPMIVRKLKERKHENQS